MLSLFRNRGLMNVVYGVIIVGMVLVFVIQFNPSAGKKTASLGEQCAARVRGWCIDPKDHMAAFRILIPRNQQGELLTAKAKSMGLLKIALDGLVERELLVHEAERVGISATEDEITNEIFNGFIHVSVPSDRPELAYSLRVGDGKIYVGFKNPKTKRFDMDTYRRNLKQLTGRSENEFREEQGRELIAAKMRDVVRSPIRVSEPEAFESYVSEKSTATVRYVAVKQSFVARYGVTATPAEVDAWAKDKTNSGLVDATVNQRKPDVLPKAGHVRHILVKFPPTATPDDKAAALGKLARGVQRIKAGEAFADVARDLSDDTGSAAHGGDVGDKTDGFVLPFKKAADALKPGETTSAAIETQFGYHLITKDDPAKAADAEAALRRDVERELFAKTKALDTTKTLASKILSDIRNGKTAEDAIQANIAPLVKPAPALSLPVVTQETAAAPSANADAGAKEAGATALTGDAGAAKPAAPPTPKTWTADTDPDRPDVVTSGAFNKGGDPIPALSSEATATVLKFAFNSKDGDTVEELIRTDDGFMIVQLKDHKLATKEEFDKQKETYLETLVSVKQAEALSLYVRRLREAAKDVIKVDEKYLAEKMGPTRDGGAPTPMEGEDEEGP